MQVDRKSGRSVASRGVMMLALLAVVGATQANDAVEIPSPEAQAQMLQLLETQSLYRNQVDWPATRAQLKAAAGSPAQVRRVLDGAIASSSGGHGRWMPPQWRQRRAQQLREAAASAQGGSAPALPSLDRRLGQMTINGYSSAVDVGVQRTMQLDIQQVAQWQDSVRSMDAAPRCGWVLDLRGNHGGNMWPMLLGAAPLLRTTVTADEEVGTFASADGPQPWQSTPEGVRQAGRSKLALGQPGYLLKRPAAPVAVLTGPGTGSSGEAMVLAFRGRPASRSFGQPTAGVSTANQVQKLLDGSELLLTTMVMTDRNGRGDGSRIVPDEVTADDAATVAAAQRWLLAQPACQASAP